MSEPVTAAEVRDAMVDAGITSVRHHDCAICGMWTRYIREGERLFYDSSCGCAESYPTPRDWSYVADWINSQSPEWQAKLRQSFGLPAAFATKDQP